MEYDLDANMQGFIGIQVLPVMEVAKQAGNFGKIPIEQLLKTRDTRRASGAGYARGEFTFTPATYACEEHGAEDPVDDREATMYAEYFDAEQIATARARNSVLLNAEVRIADAIFNATTWTSYTTAVGTEWDTSATADPRADVKAAMQSVWSQCGMWPNAMIIDQHVFQNLQDVDAIISRAKYQGFMDVRPGNINAQQIAACLGIDRLIIAGGARDSSKEGQDTTIASVWDDEYAMVCRIATTNDIREPCIGRVFHWGEDGSNVGGMVESYRDETVRADVMRCRHEVDELILYVETGHLLSNITT
jgi:hypothetical protein